MVCLGIDIGSVAVSAAVVGEDESVLSADYRFHRGAIGETLRASLEFHGRGPDPEG